MIESFYNRSELNPVWTEFRSQGFPAVHFNNPNSDDSLALIENLPPFLRTLIITDGTVTRALEAFFWEPIAIEQRKLQQVTAQHPIPWLNSSTGEPLLIREVQLIGGYSGKIYTSAYSIIRLDRLPSYIREPLIHGSIGIGVLISQFGVESYREILDIGHAQNLDFGNDNDTGKCSYNIVYRSYRIIIEKEPVILITEKFPTAIYKSET